jgi:hypothetical protein
MKMITNFAVLFAIILILGCNVQPNGSVQVEPPETPFPTPVSVDAAINYIKSDDYMQRIVGMWAITNFREGIPTALPLIIDNLLHDLVTEVRINAARVLGEFGPSADGATNSLISAMKFDNSIEVKIEAAIALGAIKNEMAVPALAENLSSNNEKLAVFSAKSIALITDEPSDSSGYRRDSDGNPLIVLAAKEWWEHEGQYSDWTK